MVIWLLSIKFLQTQKLSILLTHYRKQPQNKRPLQRNITKIEILGRDVLSNLPNANKPTSNKGFAFSACSTGRREAVSKRVVGHHNRMKIPFFVNKCA